MAWLGMNDDEVNAQGNVLQQQAEAIQQPLLAAPCGLGLLVPKGDVVSREYKMCVGHHHIRAFLRRTPREAGQRVGDHWRAVRATILEGWSGRIRT